MFHAMYRSVLLLKEITLEMIGVSEITCKQANRCLFVYALSFNKSGSNLLSFCAVSLLPCIVLEFRLEAIFFNHTV